MTNVYTLLRSSKNAFIMQSKSTFLEFLRGIHRYKFGLPKKFFRGEIIQGEWRNFHRARALFLTGVEFHVLPCVLVCFLVEFDLLFAFSVLSLDCASLFIYVHEHDRLCFRCQPRKQLYFIHTEIFASNFALWKSVSDFTSTNQRGETSFSHVKKSFRPITNQLKPRFKRIVFSRAFSRSSRVALSGSFDKILYFRCTRVVRNSNFQVIKS